MKPVFLKELEQYKTSFLQEIFKCNQKQVNEVLIDLIDRKIIEKDKNRTEDLYKFTYVGFIEYQGQFIFVMPKFIRDQEFDYYYSILVRLLYEYNERENLDNEEIETFGETELEKNFNVFTLLFYLLEDYFENGLYKSEKFEHEINGEGEIQWVKTIENSTAYLTGGNLIYVDLFTRNVIDNADYYIKKVHMYVLNESISILKELELLEVLDIPELYFDVDSEQLGEIEFIVNKVEVEKSTQFIDRNIMLLDAMMNFLLRKNDYTFNDKIHLFGTRNFEIVWEKVCGYVFDNEYDYLKKIIPFPIWKDYKTLRETPKEKDVLKPDILKKLNKKKMFFIFDAKYYTTSFNQQGKLIHSSPGIGDITKQYLYELIYQKYFKDEKFKFYNVFLLPTTSKNEVFGHTSFSLFDGLGPIFLIRLNAMDIFNWYIERKQKNEKHFEEIAKQIDYLYKNTS